MKITCESVSAGIKTQIALYFVGLLERYDERSDETKKEEL
jgi:hypothetical protein